MRTDRTYFDLLGEQRDRLELLAAGKPNARSQPVARNWLDARRPKLAGVSTDQLHLLCGTLGGDKSQCSREVLGRKRLACFVVDVQVDRSPLHDEFDHDLVVAPTHGSAVRRWVVAVCIGVPESEHV